MSHSFELPSFADARALDASPGWRRYLDTVYGVATLRYPLSLRELSFFYLALLPPSHQPRAPLPLLGLRPGHEARLDAADATVEASGRNAWGVRQPHYGGRAQHEAFSLYAPQLSAEGRNATLWLYAYAADGTSAEEHGVPSGAKVEVHRCAEDDRPDERLWWMYRAPGSGVFFDVGRTFAARNLYTLAAALNVSVRSRYCRAPRQPGTRPPCANRREHMVLGFKLVAASVEVLAAAGFDSLQLTHTEEHGIFKFEIVDLRPLRAGAQGRQPRRGQQPPPAGSSARACPGPTARRSFWRGWRGVLPCGRCDARRGKCLNCANHALTT